MMVHAEPDDLEKLREAWPDWMIRTSPSASWRATRRGAPLTMVQLSAGLAETLLADSYEDLAAQLEQQRDKAGETP